MLTLTEKTFSEACQTLALDIRNAGFTPDIIIGIATGGDYVAARLADSFPEAKILSVSLQRPTTPLKSRLAPIIRRLPRWLNNLLRRLEHYWREDRLYHGHPALPDFSLPTQVSHALAQDPRANILIADDAVDSGMTMLAVRQAVVSATPQADIRTAVITVTQQKNHFKPDFNLLNVLIRFPWSIDA